MTPQEHYAEAERLMGLAEGCDWTINHHQPYLWPALAAAQVHATLATANPTTGPEGASA